MEDLPKAIHDRRQETGVSQPKLGLLLGVSESTVARWEKGVGFHSMRAVHVVRLATWLGRSPADVLLAAVALSEEVAGVHS